MAALQWKLDRAGIIQEAMLDMETSNCAPAITTTYSQIDRTGMWVFPGNIPALIRLCCT
ncbi:MAG: hypothetical protein HY820_45025 [Acidobacteria bacterium]|nr:hypothetical protein [Acidobacteriota bacterium]